MLERRGPPQGSVWLPRIQRIQQRMFASIGRARSHLTIVKCAAWANPRASTETWPIARPSLTFVENTPRNHRENQTVLRDGDRPSECCLIVDGFQDHCGRQAPNPFHSRRGYRLSRRPHLALRTFSAGKLGPNRSLHFACQRAQMLGEPREQLALLRVGSEIPDQRAFGCVSTQLLEMRSHVLYCMSPARCRSPASEGSAGRNKC